MEENQGIMSLAPQVAPPPQMGANMQRTPLEDPEVAQAYEQLRSSVGPKEFTDEVLAATEQANPELVAQFKQVLSQQQLPADLVAALQDMLQLIFESPQDYAEIRKELLAEGVPEDLLPETFDLEFFVALKMALEQVQGTVPQQPMGLAEGGIVSLHPLARELQKFGRNGDTMLAHINPVEAEMLKRMGGSGTINPYTGLPEFFLKKVVKSIGKAISNTVKSVGKVFKSVVNEVKRFAKSEIGRIVITVAAAYFLGPYAANLLSVTSTAGVAAVSGFVGSFSSGVAAGDGVKNSLKAGAVGAVTAGTLAVAAGGTAALQAGSYTGPTTISGQYDKLKQSLADFGTPKLADQAAAVNPTAGPLDPGVSPVSPGPPAAAVTPIDSSFSPVPDVNPSGFSYDPVSGEFIPSVPTDVGLGNPGAQPFVPSGDYLSTLDAQNLANTGGGVPTQNVIPAMQPASYSLPGAAPADYSGAGSFKPTVGLGGQPTAYTPNYLTGEVAASGTGIAPGITGAPPATAIGTSAQPGFFEQIGQGDFTGAAKTGYQNVKDFYNPQASEEAIGEAYKKELASRAGFNIDISNPAVQESARAAAVKSAAPMLGTYSRLAATGLGAAYLGGAFDPPPPPEVPEGFSGPTGTDLLAQNPAEYGFTPGGASTATPFASYPGMAPTSLGYGTTNLTYAPSGYAQSQAPQGQGLQPFMPPSLMALNLRGYNPMGIAGLAPRRYNVGGFVPGYQKGGSPQRMSDYPRRTGPINGPGTGTSDSIPAMLSDGEFVFTANAVRGAGNGSRREGARKMYAMMKALERKS
jgi:hypothetical protein